MSSCFSTSKDITKEVSDWVMYLIANLNGDTSFLLAPPLTSSSKSGSPMCLSSSSNTGAPSSSQALSQSQTAGLPPAGPPPLAPHNEGNFIVDVYDGAVEDLPDSLPLQVVVIGEEGAHVSVEQAGQEHHDEQRMVIDIKYNACYIL